MTAKGIIILGHGSRRKTVSQSFSRMVGRIAQRISNARVEPAFFSLGRPTLEEKASELIAEGCKEIIIFPYFLYNGNHVEKDIPTMLQSLKQKYSEINFRLLNTLENEPLLEEIIYKRIWPYTDEQTK
ncbi:sirohydrochlorin chelatase [Desulfovulcanus sp.]